MRWLLAFFLATFLPVAGAIPPPLQPISASEQHTAAIVLVGGVNNTFQYFDPWVEELLAQDATLYGFTGDHRAQPMTSNGQALATALQGLQVDGVTHVTILAHSLG